MDNTSLSIGVGAGLGKSSGAGDRSSCGFGSGSCSGCGAGSGLSCGTHSGSGSGYSSGSSYGSWECYGDGYGCGYGYGCGCVSGEIDDDGESNRQEHLKKEAVSKVSQAEKVTPVMSKGKISKQQGSLLYAMSMKLNAKNKLDMEAILKSNGFKTVYEVTEDRFEWAKEGINKMLNTQPKDSEPEMEEAPF